ncbi:hypothetical protein GCM10010271_69830 [Streptomyces kurssanovii]|nr:hypothetical protein GCM10010271_69830 [Streptomyces kurssanovii]
MQSGSFPTFTKVVGVFDDGYDLRLDVLFTSGLKALLDGLAPLIEGHRDRHVDGRTSAPHDDLARAGRGAGGDSGRPARLHQRAGPAAVCGGPGRAVPRLARGRVASLR